MHRRYSEFASLLVPQLSRSFEAPLSSDTDAERKERFNRRRVVLKFLAELFVCGLYQDYTILLAALADAVRLNH